MSEIATAYVQIVPTAKGIQSAIEDAVGEAGQSSGGKLGSALAGGIKSAGAMIIKATTAMAGELASFGASAVKTGAAFDSAMSQVAATMGKSVSDIGELRDFAQEMGSTTAFSASQAAEALNYMALAGYDADKSMQMLPTVLDLAAAGGMELARASDMVTDAQSALGLTLDETKDMVNQMAKASSMTNTSVEQLGDAFLKIGATARNVSGGTNELATVLGVLADNGIKGTEGGTHLRNILLSLQSAAVDGVADFGDFAVSIYDADGNMRSLVDIIGDMQGGMDGMSQAAKDALVSGVFNKTDLAAVNALLGTESERYAEIADALGDAGDAASEMAKTQLDNLAGDITIFQSALEGAKITISDQLTPALRGLVQFGSDGVSRLTEAFKEGGLTGAMEAFGGILSEGLNMAVQRLPEMVNAGMQLMGALGQGILDNLDVIIDAAVQIITQLMSGLVQALPRLTEGGLQIIMGLANGIAEMLPELVPAIVDAVLLIAETLLDNIDLLLDAAGKLVIGLAKGLVQAIPILVEKAPVILVKFVAALLQGTVKLVEVGVELVMGLIMGIFSAFASLGKAIGSFVGEIVNQFKGLLGIHSPSTVFAGFGNDLIQGLINGIKGMLANLGEAVLKVVDKVTSVFTGLFEKAKNWGRDLIGGFIDGIKEKIGKVKDAVSSIAQTVSDYIHFSEPDVGPLANFHTFAPDMMELFTEGIYDNIRMVGSAMNALTGGIREQFASPFGVGDIGSPTLYRGVVMGQEEASQGYGTVPAWGGNITIPVYIGNRRIEEIVIDAVNINNYRSGGR